MKKIITKFFFFINLQLNTFCKVADEKNKIDDSVLVGKSLEIKNFGKGIDKLELELLNNVQYKIGNRITIYCESLKNSTNKKGEKLIIFSSNCKIKDDKDEVEITAKNFEYNISKQNLYIKDNVICKVNDSVLTTEQCHYDINKNVLILDKKGKIKKDDINIISNKGEFYINNNNFILWDDVILNQKNDFKLSCYSLNYSSSEIICSGGNDEGKEYIKVNTKGLNLLTKNNIFISTENNDIKLSDVIIKSDGYLCFGRDVIYKKYDNLVFIENGFELLTKTQIKIVSDGLKYNEDTKEGELIGDTMVEVIGNTLKDNIYLTADKFTFKIINPKDEVLPIDKLDKFDITQYKNSEMLNAAEENNDGINKVTLNDKRRYNSYGRGFKLKGTPFILNGDGNVQIYSENFKCKSDTFTFKNNRITFDNKVIIWQSNNKLTAGTADIYLDSEIRKIVLKDKPFVALFKNAYPNQIKCDNIFIGFRNNKIDKILFDENVETLLFIYDDNNNNNVLKYINNMKTSQICVLFDKNSNPMKILFNSNNGKIIPRKYIDDNVLFLDRYNNLNEEEPLFDDFVKKIKKVSFIPEKFKDDFFRNN